LSRSHAHPIPSRTGDDLRSCLLVLAASALGGGVATAIWFGRALSGFDLRYSDSRMPMLVEADGYFHLHRAQELLAGKAGWLGEPGLSALGAALHVLTRMPLELVAFCLPCLMGIACGLWIHTWGRLLSMTPGQRALAAFTLALMPAWFLRASPGWFDTDPGIAFFWHGCLFATASLGLATGRPRLRPLLLLAACALLLAWWWKPGAVLLPLCMLLWGSTFPLAQDARWRKIRRGAFILLAGCAVLFLLLPAPLLPEPLASYRNYLSAHAAMLTSPAKDAVYISISELAPMSVGDLLTDLGGNAVAAALALGATLLLCCRHPKASAFFLPSFACLGLALVAERFLYLAALPVALGVGALPSLASWLKERLATRLPSPAHCTRLAWAISLGIVLCLGQRLSTMPQYFVFQESQDRLARTLKRMAPPDAKLWNWWDDGYFLAARSGLAPLFDGGSQTPRKSYIAAHPLVADEPLLAKRWIRFFALRGEQALEPLQAAWGDEASVWRNLDAVLAAADVGAALAALPPTGHDADWFAPEGKVYLYLPQRFLLLSKWWVGLGQSPTPDATTFKPHIDAFKRGNFAYRPEIAKVVLPQEMLDKGYNDFGGVFLTSRAPLAAPWGGNQPGPYLVASDISPWLYAVDEPAIRSIAFRLLAPGGANLPGFEPLLTNFAHGGLWEVVP